MRLCVLRVLFVYRYARKKKERRKYYGEKIRLLLQIMTNKNDMKTEFGDNIVR